MKKIYWYYPHLKFWMGGTRYLYELLRRLRGYEKIVVCNGGDKKIIREFEGKNIRIVQPIQMNTNSSFYWIVFPISIIIEVISACVALKKADIIGATLFPSNLVCALASHFLSKEYYYLCYEPFPFFHNADFIRKQSLPKRLFLRVLSFLYGWTDIWATKQAKRIMTLDEYKRKEIQKVYSVDSHIISVGIDTDFFKTTYDRQLHEKYHLSKKIILHSTDYSELKRTDLVLRAWRKVISRIPEAQLLITSTQPNSPDKKRLIELIQKLKINDSVQLLGLVPIADLPKYYTLAACYVSACTDPIVATNLPVKEAMACGIPAIRSKTAADDVTDGVSGYIVDPEDSDLLAERICTLLVNEIKAKEMGTQARKYIVSRYSWDSTVGRFTSLLG